MIPSISTPLLTLIPLETAHAEILFRINQTEDVLRYFPTTTPPPLERVQRFIASQQEHWDEHGYGNWGIVPNGETQIVGWVGLQYLPELNETEVGYLLDTPYWGKGFATEAARASIGFGFARCNLKHIIALVHPENLASRRVIEKCGMTYIETIHLWGIDLMRHRIAAEAWTEVHQNNIRAP
jgi:RimJ/RimL family protein N-acetyltransferase